MDSRDIEKWRVELDSYAHVEDGVEYWLARDLMEPLGYTQWRNFETAVKRSMASCDTNKMPVAAHFAEASKMVDAGIAKRAVSVLPGPWSRMPVSVARLQLLCLPEPLMPANGFSWRSTRKP